MSTESQPRDPRIPVYLPENWLPLDAAASTYTGQFINFPTAQTANLYFPGTINSNNYQSFATSSTMSVGGNLTSGNLKIADTFAYAGGVNINTDGTTLTANTVKIGNSSKPVIMPKVNLTDIEPIGVAGIFINSDTTINAGKILSTNSVQAISGSEINLGDKLRIDYPPTVSDLYIGSYRTANYQTLSSLTINGVQERIIGSLSSSLAVGVYQVNFNAGLRASVSKPYLSLGLYTDGSSFTNGALRTTGILDNSLYTLGHYWNNNNTQSITATLSGLLILTTPSYIAFVMANGDGTTLSLTYTDTYLSLVRLG